MQLDIGEMRSGANLSYSAAHLALEGAGRLARSTVAAGIFGEFLAAETFCGVLHDAHRSHAQRLRDQQSRLGVLGDKAHTTASAFLGMEERNGQALRSLL